MIPEKVKPVVAQEYKWISRVGDFETSARVLIGERETRTSTYSNYFVAFNYDLRAVKKHHLTSFNKGFMEWKFKNSFDSIPQEHAISSLLILVARNVRLITFSVHSALIQLMPDGG